MQTRSALLLVLYLCLGILSPQVLAAGISSGTEESERSPEASPSPAERKYLQTNYLFNRGHYALAIPEYEQLLKEHPGYPQRAAVHYALALCHFHIYEALTRNGSRNPAGVSHDPSELPRDSAGPSRPPVSARSDPAQELHHALHHAKAAVRDKSLKARGDAALLLGRCLLLRGEYAGAVKVFRWARDNTEDRGARAEAALGLGESYLQKGDFKKAQEHFADARKNGATPAIREQADFQHAMATYHASRPDSASATESASAVESAGGAGAPPSKAASGDHLAGALETFQRMGANPKSRFQKDSLYMAGIILSSQGKYDEARAPLESLLSEEPSDFDELARLAIARNDFDAGRLTNAEKELLTLVERYPDSPRATEIRVLLSRVLLKIGKPSAAEDLLHPLTASNRLPYDAALSLSRSLRRQGKHAQAARMLKSALAESTSPQALLELSLELGAVQAAAGDFTVAAEAFTSIVAEHPTSPRAPYAAYMKAYCLNAARRYESSSTACREFLSSWPDSPFGAQVRELEAENLFFLGRYEDARVRYQRLLDGTPPESTKPEAGGGLSRIKARFRLAQIAFFSGDNEKAAASLKSIAGAMRKLRVDITRPEAAFLLSHRYYLGLALLAGEQAAAAASALREYLDQTSRLDARERSPFAAQIDDARYQLGRALTLANDPEARKAYEDALRINPESPHRHAILFELGRLSFDAGDRKAARETLASILNDRNDRAPAGVHARALFLLGSIALAGESPAAAAGHFRALADAFPDHPLAPEARLQLARALRATGDTTGAKEVLADLAATHPDHKSLGGALLESAAATVEVDPEQGLKELEEIEEMPAARALRVKILYEKAWCYRALNDKKNTTAAYEALLAAPAAGEADAALIQRAALELAELKFDAGDYRGALAILESQVQNPASRAPVTEDTLYRLCWCYHKLGQPEQTIATFERLHKSFPQSFAYPETAILAAKAHLQAGRTDKAHPLFESVTSRFGASPEAPLARVSIGECLMKEREFGKAAQVFATFLREHGDTELAPRARFGLGWCAENLGDIDKALRHYTRVAESYGSPAAARAQFQIGQCHVSRKDYQRAIVEFLKVPSTYTAPQWSSKAILQVAGCFETLGDEAKAKAYYKEVITDYSERTNEVALAKRRLQQLSTR